MAHTQIQKGHLCQKGSKWHARWREETAQPDGSIRIVNRSKVIASIAQYPRKREVWPLFVETMSKLNRAGFGSEAGTDLDRFFEVRYLPWAEENLAPSTSKNYRQVWKQRLAPRIGNERVRDVRPLHIERVLVSIVHDNPDLSKRTVQRAKALLSGIFTRAVALGLVDRNPVTEVALPKVKSAEKETYAYQPEEVERMVAVLPEPARSVVAVAAYAGLTVSEIRGLKWGDYDADNRLLHVRRSVWRSIVGETKTRARRKPVPVISRLKRILDARFQAVPFHCSDDWMFPSELGTPLDLANLVNRTIKPTVEKEKLAWRGYHAFRRALATTLYSSGTPELTVQRILRHKPGSAVTRTHYIQTPEAEVIDAMERFEQSMGSCSPSVPRWSN